MTKMTKINCSVSLMKSNSCEFSLCKSIIILEIDNLYLKRNRTISYIILYLHVLANILRTCIYFKNNFIASIPLIPIATHSGSQPHSKKQQQIHVHNTFLELFQYLYQKHLQVYLNNMLKTLKKCVGNYDNVK